jgi:hypothetical protein
MAEENTPVFVGLPNGMLEIPAGILPFSKPFRDALNYNFSRMITKVTVEGDAQIMQPNPGEYHIIAGNDND